MQSPSTLTPSCHKDKERASDDNDFLHVRANRLLATTRALDVCAARDERFEYSRFAKSDVLKTTVRCFHQFFGSLISHASYGESIVLD